MNQQAQNALLKTIEEPPAYAVIIMPYDQCRQFYRQYDQDVSL